MRAAGVMLMLGVSLLAVACGGDTSESGQTQSAISSASSSAELSTVAIETSGGKKVEVRAEIADSEAEQAKGLMDRTALGKNRGMLFVFPDEQPRSFWMKNTLIPLSIAYMDSEGRIIDIQDMKPLDDDPPHYDSAKPAQYALEVNKGFFDERGVEVGDRARLPR